MLQHASTFRDSAHRLLAVGWCAVFVYAFCPATTTHRHPFLGAYVIGSVTSSGSLSVGPVKQRSMSIVATMYFYRKVSPCWKSSETSSTPSPVSSLRPSSSSAAPSTKSPSPLATKAPALLCGGFLRSGDTSAGPRYAQWGRGPPGPPRQGRAPWAPPHSSHVQLPDSPPSTSRRWGLLIVLGQLLPFLVGDRRLAASLKSAGDR